MATTPIPTKRDYTGNMMRPLLWKRERFGLVLTTPEHARVQYYPTFYVPVPLFLNAGAVWQQLNLCTIFWERPAWGVERSDSERSRTQKAYLLAFPTYDAPISGAWAEDCLMNNKHQEYKAYFELTIFEPGLVEQIKRAFQRHGAVCTHGEENVFNVSVPVHDADTAPDPVHDHDTASVHDTAPAPDHDTDTAPFHDPDLDHDHDPVHDHDTAPFHEPNHDPDTAPDLDHDHDTAPVHEPNHDPDTAPVHDHEPYHDPDTALDHDHYPDLYHDSAQDHDHDPQP
jgi:hypothetical protein